MFVSRLAGRLHAGKALAQLFDKLLALLGRRLGIGRHGKVFVRVDECRVQVVTGLFPALLVREQLDEEVRQRSRNAEEEDVRGA